MLESNVKRSISDYLQYGMNQGRWLFLRLQSGELIVLAGETRRRIKLCPPGTADFVVFRGNVQNLPICEVTFIESKSSKGKTSKEQDEFAEKVRQQNCRYYVVRDAEELEELLGSNGNLN